MLNEMIDAKYLEGLTFTESSRKTVTENGEGKTVYSVEERPLTPDDVLAFRDYGTSVTIIAADGRKHVVDKSVESVKSVESSGSGRSKKME